MENLNEMEPASPVNKEGFVCQTCGDKGFTNAYIFCGKCLEFVIHRYCLYEMPKTFIEKVKWYCESCKPSVQNQVTSPQESSESQNDNTETKQNIDLIWSEISSSDSDFDSNSSSSSSNRKAFDEWEARISQQNHRIDTIIEDMIISYPDLILGYNPCIPKKRSCDGENCNSTHSDHHHHQKKKKKKKKKEEDIVSVIEETKEVFCQTLPENNHMDTKEESQMPKFESNGHFVDECYVIAQPIVDPVWRGSFNVGDDIFEGFLGHLSNKACDKVCEEANMMPSLLELEMHPKTHLWPNSFKDMEPSDDHIALYFFPGDLETERVFDDLVQDMMNEDLAMRATVKNADLLIFTSEALPPMFRRFQGKYYLWGVFRAKRNKPILVEDHTS